MNVMLNMVTVDARAERAGMGTHRGEAEAESGDFPALFDRVGRAPADERGLGSDPSPRVAAENAPEDGAADAPARHAQKRRDDEQMTLDVPAEAVPAEPDRDAPDNATATRLPVEDGPARRVHSDAGAEVVAPLQADTDGADVSVTRGQPDQPHRRKAGKALPADGGAATAPYAAAAAAPAGAVVPGEVTVLAGVSTPEPKSAAKNAANKPVTSGDARQTDRTSDGRVSPPDAKIAISAGATFAVPRAASGNADLPLPQAATGRTDRRTAGRTDRANDDEGVVWRAPPGQIREPATERANGGSRATVPHGDMAPADKAGQTGKTGPEVSVAPSSEPAAAKADAGSGPIHIWARGETAAAFAPRADGDRPMRAYPSADMAQTPSSRGTDTPIDVRVASGEPHQTNPAPAGGGQIAVAAGDRPGNDAAPKAEGTAQVGIGSVDRPQAAARDRGWRPLSFLDRTESPAPAKVSADRRMAVKEDRIAVREAATRSEPDAAGVGETRQANPAVAPVSGRAEEKRQAAIAQSSPANNSPASASAPGTAPTAPLTAGVASGIANALAAARTASAASSAPVRLDPATEVGAAEPVKTIALALDMREHGQVDLRISLRGSAVSVQVRVERAETADALARDDATLREVLHRAGYETQQVQIDRRDGTAVRTGDAPSSGQAAGGTGTGGFSGQTAGDQRAATPGERAQARRDDTAFSLQDQDTDDAPRQDRYRGPDRLYV